MGENFLHKPVLLQEVMHFLDPADGDVIVDATIGGAGHAKEILRRIGPSGLLIGIDKDKESLKIADEQLKSSEGSFRLMNGNFKDLKNILQDSKTSEVDGILFDLGISSIQMESAERGFSIKNSGPLDMRMDKTQHLTAATLVNNLSEFELSRLIKHFGEERFHKRIAASILRARREKKIETTAELAQIISRSMPYGRRRERIHPATRTFQALRIKVNEELSAMEEALKDAPSVLKKGGRLCVISFHSLEDRIAKTTLREFSAQDVFQILTKKPVMAKGDELMENPRARSAKLRAAIKL
ncbi:MAG: 16S rRNA (cytosine(1402)-N(4))-methyltransferase RsmH [Candidatus Gorgyraea atricola]|nr:16S rRNA (cytosine(1402)-N(4))-methyltransferase RsmH [Candidatus Gorgyraea atricola]